jgi:GGDEF domain-containing protein
VTLGFDHVQLTARLLKRWNLPELLVTAIGAGGSTVRIEQLPPAQRPLPQILHLADLLAGMLMEGRADWLGRLLQVGKKYHELTETQLIEVVNSLQIMVDQLADVLSLDLPQGIDYTEIYREAHRQLSADAELAAVDLAHPQELSAGTAGENDAGDEDDLLLSETKSLATAVRRFTHSTHKQLTPPANVRTAATPAAAPRTAHQTMLPAASDIAAVQSATIAVQASAEADPQPPAEPTDQIHTISRHAELLQKVVARSIANCRDERAPLSLILVAIDRLANRTKNQVEGNAPRLVQMVALVCGKIDHPRLVQLPAADDRVALVLPDCDRPAARVFSHFVLDEVRRLSGQQPELAEIKLSVSVGVATAATPAKNFPAQSLIESANRCLHSAQLSGGNTVKSIDVL